MGVLTIGVNFHQLQANGLALRMLLQGLAQDFFGLYVAPVGDIDIGLGNRVDFIALVAAANAEIRTEHAVLRGVDALTTGCAKQRVGARHHSAFLRQKAVLEAMCLLRLLLATAIHNQPPQQGDHQAAQAQGHRVAQQRREERFFLNRRRSHNHRRLLRRGSRSRRSSNRCAGSRLRRRGCRHRR